jgi:hypothetical protein
VEGIPIAFKRRGNLTKDYIYKPSAAKRLGLEVLEVHEDDFEFLKSFKELYPNAKTYLYLLFTATYWGINYQLLTTLIALLTTAIAREEKKLLKKLYTALAIYIASGSSYSQ